MSTIERNPLPGPTTTFAPVRSRPDVDVDARTIRRASSGGIPPAWEAFANAMSEIDFSVFAFAFAVVAQ